MSPTRVAGRQSPVASPERIEDSGTKPESPHTTWPTTCLCVLPTIQVTPGMAAISSGARSASHTPFAQSTTLELATMKRRILLVDDELAILLTLKAILEMNGFEVETASSAREGIQKLEKNTYNMVITDMRMEHETAGYDVI